MAEEVLRVQSVKRSIPKEIDLERVPSDFNWSPSGAMAGWRRISLRDEIRWTRSSAVTNRNRPNGRAARHPKTSSTKKNGNHICSPNQTSWICHVILCYLVSFSSFYSLCILSPDVYAVLFSVLWSRSGVIFGGQGGVAVGQSPELMSVPDACATRG
ncbi:hypothetical protein EVAR_101776_1 [Eumeta japonica]|uniref:Uncharacterized protein n=1 Tax=Eumeta variegata TaxID=151549 RepID=A0A4C1SPZ5_EUMVA|nr:hypothetical protein EVAR_101776_1 [Eumeta japonica]